MHIWHSSFKALRQHSGKPRTASINDMKVWFPILARTSCGSKNLVAQTQTASSQQVIQNAIALHRSEPATSTLHQRKPQQNDFALSCFISTFAWNAKPVCASDSSAPPMLWRGPQHCNMPKVANAYLDSSLSVSSPLMTKQCHTFSWQLHLGELFDLWTGD